MEIIRNPSLCYGCRTCQLICSFHHTGGFWPDRSSIDVLRNPQTGVIKWSIDSTCDECKSEKEPLCIKYCAYKAIRAASSKVIKRRGK